MKGEIGNLATTLWAVVASNGEFVRGSDVSTMGRLGPGVYYVEFFQRVISQCSGSVADHPFHLAVFC